MASSTSATRPEDAGLNFIVRDGRLSQKDESEVLASLSALSLIRKLHDNNSVPDPGLVGDEGFSIVLYDSHLCISSTTSTNLNKRLVVEGTWTIKSSSESTNGSKQCNLSGNDELSGFLLEMTVAQKNKHATIDLDRSRLLGNQLQRLTELIETSWWQNLTRRIEVSNPALYDIDTKVREDDPQPRIYVPKATPEQYEHYIKLSKDNPELRLDVRSLPSPPLTAEYIQSLNAKPGLLALAMDEVVDVNGSVALKPLPYVVPGGRFNELYGWDTYFTALGLLEGDFAYLCEAMLRNFCFCIQHYGKIFNANRTYYLGRSQPPFLTSFGTAVCQKLDQHDPKTIELVRSTLFASIKDYYTVWTADDHLDKPTGLSRYHGQGKGFPPECEPHHFDAEIAHIASKYKMSLEDFIKAYDKDGLHDEELDELLKHDRAGRESGHDTTYRFVGRGANLATVDLNSCLHKYEIDIVSMLDTYFDGSIEVPLEWRAPGMPEKENSSTWLQRAVERREAMTQFLWSSEKGTFVDYDVVNHVQVSYDNATALWPLWAKAASTTQAESTVRHCLSQLETYGGLTASTETSRGTLSPERPQRQWDFPHGWAPHQMLAWVGLKNYGFEGDAERLIYRWLSMVVKTFANHNGLVVEKYDVTSEEKSHVVEAEYGNQGSDFGSKVQTGFGWTNASVVYGANMLRGLRKE